VSSVEPEREPSPAGRRPGPTIREDDVSVSVAQRIIRDHLVEGEMSPGSPIGLHVDQTLTQDATGTLVMLELEAMGLDRVRTEVSVQYVDHNLIQEDHKNPDDHLFLRSAAARFGLWYSKPGNGISHPVHQERFGRPGATMAGSDSHTPAAGAIGMIAIGSGGLDVALAMAGEPLRIRMPEIWGVELVGHCPSGSARRTSSSSSCGATGSTAGPDASSSTTAPGWPDSPRWTGT
jgi:aconitate hydratase